jgi:hypothetical protein
MNAATKLPASLDAERHRLIARLAHIIEDDFTSCGIDVFDLCLSEVEKEVTSNDEARPIADELWLRKDEQVDVEAEKLLLVFAIRELTELRRVPWI